MKANEAPEKLYITNDENRFGDKCHSASTEKYVDDDIEYVRKDVFIDKACAWLNDNVNKYWGTEFVDTGAMVEDYRKYMED